MTTRVFSAAVLALVACGVRPEIHSVRFANRQAVEIVDDRRDVPRPPKERLTLVIFDGFDASVQRPLTRALELPRQRRALGVNALDEVPDSTWFTNRIGTHALSPDQVRTGPVTIDGPEHHLPWTVTSTKQGGTSVGFVIRDARNIKYLLKFDSHGFPELETATNVIVNRLLWAAGYNVPEDQIAYVRPDQLVLARDAAVKGRYGGIDHALTRAELDRELAKIEHEADGRIRVMASRWLDGKPLGAPSVEGVREDDPNDRIPHEMRRDLRGTYPIFAWVDHVDVQTGNFLDMWVADPIEPARHYVEHYAIDFGRSFGAMAAINHDLRHSYAYLVDLPANIAAVFGLGVGSRPWEGVPEGSLRGVSGLYDLDTFDPGAWRPGLPFVPYDAADRFDMFWGAKLVARFTRDQLRAAVDAGQLSDPRARAWLVDRLVARQRATAAYWFQRVNPLDHFATRSTGELCFDDLAIDAALASAGTTSYAIATYDATGTPLVRGGVAASSARTCTPPIALSGEPDGYTIVEIATTRPGFHGATFVHLSRGPSAPRVIGVWRD